MKSYCDRRYFAFYINEQYEIKQMQRILRKQLGLIAGFTFINSLNIIDNWEAAWWPKLIHLEIQIRNKGA